MDMIALSPFARNPYRILGLNGGANQASIDEAAHGLDEALLQRVPKAAPWDIPWLGPLDSEEADIEYAVRRLEDPSLRLRERLMWFHEGESLMRGLSPETIDSVISKWSKIDRPSAKHDTALLSVIAAFYLDIEIKDEGRWLNTMSMWTETVATDAYWSGIVDIESEGGFAAAATIHEITNLKNVAGLAVADIVAAIAKDAAMRSDAPLIRRALHLLRSASLPANALADKENEIFGVLEEQFYALCADLRRQCNDDIRQDGRSIETNKLVCRAALERFDSELLPKLDFILGLEGPVSLRTRERATFCVHGLAMDHLWTEEFSTVQRLLEKAKELAPGDSIILGRIEESMATVAEKMKQSEVTGHVHAQVHDLMHDQIAWKPIPESTLKKKMSPELKGVIAAAFAGVAVAVYIIIVTGKPEKNVAQQPVQQAAQDHRTASVEKKPQEVHSALKTPQQEPVVAPPTRKELPHLVKKETSSIQLKEEAPAAHLRKTTQKTDTIVKAGSPKKPTAQTTDADIRRLRTNLDKLMAELEALRGKIDARKDEIDNYERQINSGVTVDRNAYNKALSEYNTLVRDYNERLARGRKIAADLDKLGG